AKESCERNPAHRRSAEVSVHVSLGTAPSCTARATSRDGVFGGNSQIPGPLRCATVPARVTVLLRGLFDAPAARRLPTIWAWRYYESASFVGACVSAIANRR